MVSSRHKPEFPPLLHAGLHNMSVTELKQLVVDGFPLSTRRYDLWQSFIKIIEHLKALKIPCKIWVDGSFVTRKIDPDDIDFVVDVPVHAFDNATPPQAEFLKSLADMVFGKTEKMHTFVMFDAPLIHSKYALSQTLHDQWKRDFGFSYVKKEPKGIAVIEITP
jgi:hypothetical protein